ncbi:MAG TPA: hypothetical protein VF365_04980 [Candidatus Limnocylindria bacterium]
MDPTALARYRWPMAAALLVLAVVLLWPRSTGEAVLTPSPRPSILVGDVGGDVVSPSPSVAATPIPTVSPNATPTPTQPTATSVTANDGFEAEVLACRSISGSRCNEPLGTLRPNAGSFTALVRFTEANAGDVINALLDGPSGRIDGFPYALQGGGDGYYYSEFQAGGLPAGDYTLTATRNGEVVATTSFRKAGG